MRFFTTLKPSKTFNIGHFDALASQFFDFGHILQLVPQKHEFPGWWAKMNAFAPENAPLRPFVHVDLDTLILGDPSPLADLDTESGHLWLLRGFKNIHKGNSGIMVVPRDTTEIWADFIHEEFLTEDWRGDSDFLEYYPYRKIQDTVPGILSYKTNCHRSVRPPADTLAVCFHGNPRPWATLSGRWADKHYRMHAVGS